MSDAPVSKAAPRDYRLLDALASAIPAGLCRCLACCCKPGLGHHTVQYAVYAAEMRAVERYEDAVASGLSDYEAREEGWPSGAGAAHEEAIATLEADAMARIDAALR